MPGHCDPLKAHGTHGSGAGRNAEHYLPLVQQVLDQTTRRVVHGEKVPPLKNVSIFEPTRRLSNGAKHAHETEFDARSGMVKPTVDHHGLPVAPGIRPSPAGSQS
jgi:hypothetical protein